MTLATDSIFHNYFCAAFKDHGSLLRLSILQYYVDYATINITVLKRLCHFINYYIVTRYSKNSACVIHRIEIKQYKYCAITVGTRQDKINI